MKITTFNPQIITNNAEFIVQLFEELGFEKRHNQKGIGDMEVTGIRMKDANGFHLDVSQVDSLPTDHDLTVIRMNVDNFDEAYELLLSHGFKNFYGDQQVSTGTARSTIMISPSGFAINLIEHIKK